MTEPTDSSAGPYARYSMHLSRALVDQVFHYTHYIPNIHGMTARFFEQNYPGWNLASMMRVIGAAGIRVTGQPCGMGGKCHWKVKALHFNSADDFEVEWNDEIHEDDGRYFWYGEHVPEHLRNRQGAQTHSGAFNISTDGLDLGDPEVRRSVADLALELLGAAVEADPD